MILEDVFLRNFEDWNLEDGKLGKLYWNVRDAES